MKNGVIALGIDTSNYTTSAAVVVDGEVISNRKLPLPVKKGERGLRQSDAVFAHTKNLPEIMELIRADLGGSVPDAIGYSGSPRVGEGSYMPCFLSGRAAAHAASAVSGARLFCFSHQEGHIAAALYSAKKTELLDGTSPLAAFHVSGGTTDILLVTPSCAGMIIARVGGTTDLNAGQLIDRIGVLMGESFPCGAALEALSDGMPETRGIRVSVKGLDCSLSGAENRASELWARTADRAVTSAFTLDYVAKTLDKLTDALRASYPGIPVIYAGGVMSCGRMRGVLGKRDGVYFSEPVFSADNAAGCALLTYRAFVKEAKTV